MLRTELRQTTWTKVQSVFAGIDAWRGSTGCLAMVSIEGGLRHISVSAEGRYPTWDELASARDRFAPNVPMVMLFPTRDEYVNLHDTCLHLWEQP